MRAAALLAIVTALLLAAYAQASPATQVLDKTVICTTQFDDVDLYASPRGSFAFATAQMESSGYLAVGSGQTSNSLVIVRARSEKSTVGSSSGIQGVYARAGKCFLSRKRIPLEPTGLAGPAVSWMKDYGCVVPGRIVVRVRAVLSTGAVWRRVNASLFGAKANVVSAELAVRSERTGKPIGFATLSSAGKTKLWAAGTCAS